jgi:hypothetical protein
MRKYPFIAIPDAKYASNNPIALIRDLLLCEIIRIEIIINSAATNK